MEDERGMDVLSQAHPHSKKWTTVMVVALFVIVSLTAGFFYIHRLEAAFLNNVLFYLDEIAGHDTKSVDQEIEKQWEKLGVVGKKLGLEAFQDEEELQYFLNLEMEATGFENLMLLDEQGNAYEASYLIHNIRDEEWVKRFLEQQEPFVLQDEMRAQFIGRDNSLLCGVPIEPVEIGDATFMGVVGRYRMETVKDSLQAEFFDGKGLAQVVGRDGTIITTEISQRGGTAGKSVRAIRGRRSGKRGQL